MPAIEKDTTEKITHPAEIQQISKWCGQLERKTVTLENVFQELTQGHVDSR